MAKRSDSRLRQARGRPAPWATSALDGDDVVLKLGPGWTDVPSAAALLVDGMPVAAVPVTADQRSYGARISLPNGLFGRSAALVAVPDGRPLGEPIDLASLRRLGRVEWAVQAGRIRGTVTLGDGWNFDDGFGLPVQVLVDGAVEHTCFATLQTGSNWTFECWLPRLPVYNGRLHLSLRVGGLEAGSPLVVGRTECGFTGQLDRTDQPVAQGWLVNLDDPKAPASIDVYVGGRIVYTGPARLLRPDLRDAGVGDGCCSFNVPLGPDAPRTQPREVAVRVAGTTTHLPSSPYMLDPLPAVTGYFDALEGPFAGGWAVNVHEPGAPLTVEAVCDGEVIGSGVANLFRGDVERAGMPTARCGFRFLLERPLIKLFDRDIQMRVTGTGIVLNGSPRRVSQNSNIARFLTRAATIPEPVLRRFVRQVTRETAPVRISIIMPVHETPRAWLIEALNSVLWQWSGNWELICVDDGSHKRHVADVLQEAAKADPRVRVIRSPQNRGIAAAVNLGLRAARGTHVAFMDHDDVIEPDAVLKLARAAMSTGADLIYSDEAITTDDVGSIVEVRARPGFSHDYYLSHPYFVHLVAVRTELAHRLNGYDETLPISADVDFVLRAIEHARAVAHVPSVLYRWRTHGGSTGHGRQDVVTGTMLGLLDAHLARLKLPGKAAPGLRFNEYRIDWQDDGGEVLVVIPTRNRSDLLRVAVESLERTNPGENYRIVVIDHESKEKKSVKYLAELATRHTVMPYSGPFNYAAMNNLAVRQHGGSAKYLLFLNNDVEAREPGWIARMRSLAARRDVGAVGCLLLYGDDRIQHAGVLVGFNGAADHAMKFQDAYLEKGRRHPGYNCSLTSVRDYSAVTAACMMVKRAAFRAVRGFDESFVVGFNDTDLCLRIGEAGFKVLYDGQTVLYHHESATRTQTDEVDHPEDDARLRKRWGRFFERGDPFYSPLLSARGTDHTLRQEAGCPPPRPRLVAGRGGTTAGPEPVRTRRRKAPVQEAGSPQEAHAGGPLDV